MVIERSGYLTESQLDGIFGALADPTRRAILRQLAGGAASVAEIAAPFAMSQPAISKHLKVLENAGLVERDIDRQRRPARVNADQLAAAVAWLEELRAFWNDSFDQLDAVLAELQEKPSNNKRKARKST